RRPWPRLQQLPWPGALPRGDGDALRVDRSEHGPKASVPVPEQQVGLALRAPARQWQVRQLQPLAPPRLQLQARSAPALAPALAPAPGQPGSQRWVLLPLLQAWPVQPVLLSPPLRSSRSVPVPLARLRLPGPRWLARYRPCW